MGKSGAAGDVRRGIENFLNSAGVQPPPVDLERVHYDLTIPNLYEAMGFKDHPDIKPEQQVVIDPLIERFVQLFESLSIQAQVGVMRQIEGVKFHQSNPYAKIATLISIIDALINYAQMDNFGTGLPVETGLNPISLTETEKLKEELRAFITQGEVSGASSEEPIYKGSGGFGKPN